MVSGLYNPHFCVVFNACFYFLTIQVNIERLNHKPFHYHINLVNNKDGELTAAVRIFIAPSHDETGDEFKSLNEQRHFMMEMDKFVVKRK